jgi:hypothetical protein
MDFLRSKLQVVLIWNTGSTQQSMLPYTLHKIIGSYRQLPVAIRCGLRVEKPGPNLVQNSVTVKRGPPKERPDLDSSILGVGCRLLVGYRPAPASNGHLPSAPLRSHAATAPLLAAQTAPPQ